jgi:hypothetical protein
MMTQVSIPGQNPWVKPAAEPKKLLPNDWFWLMLTSVSELTCAFRMMASRRSPSVTVNDNSQERVRFGLQKERLDNYQEGSPFTDALLQMSGDNNRGQGSSFELVVTGSKLIDLTMRSALDDASSSSSLFIEVMEGDAYIVARDGKSKARFGVVHGVGTIDVGQRESPVFTLDDKR